LADALSADDVALLRAGLAPYGSDVRWMALLEADPRMPGRPAAEVLRLWRSWSGTQIYEARAELRNDGSALLTDLLVESDPERYRGFGADELNVFREVLSSAVLDQLRELRAGRSPYGA
jgi:hypothetical protein